MRVDEDFFTFNEMQINHIDVDEIFMEDTDELTIQIGDKHYKFGCPDSLMLKLLYGLTVY